jgi:uncharacterized protein (DUF983 family)
MCSSVEVTSKSNARLWIVPQEPSIAHLLKLARRAMRLRCPRCGGGGVLRTWFHLKPVCPTCGLVFDRGESDYWIGGYTVNFIVAEVFGIGAGVVYTLVSWPNVPWTRVEYGTATLMVLLPILFFPFSRLLWLAVDLAFRPVEAGDQRVG